LQSQSFHLFIHLKTGQITQDQGCESSNGQQGSELVIEGEGWSHKDISHPACRKIMKKILKVNVQHEFLSRMDTCFEMILQVPNPSSQLLIKPCKDSGLMVRYTA
jgi:hypothetical protein